MAQKPTILVIPGSFTRPYFYDKMADGLRESGYEVFVYAHLSSRRTYPEKGATMKEDATYFRGIIEILANEGKDVIAVTHSYGGVVGSEAAEGVIKSEREKEGKQGGLVRIVYVTSVVPAVGNSLLDVGGAPSWHPAHTTKDEYMQNPITDEAARGVFADDLTIEEGKEMLKQMPLHSTASFRGKLSYPGYKYVPVSWVLCEKDVILTPKFQQGCIDMIEKESGNKVHVVKLNTGHGPNHSHPKETAHAIVEAIEKAG